MVPSGSERAATSRRVGCVVARTAICLSLHVRFGVETKNKSNKNLGQAAIDIICINTVLPFLFLQASYEDQYNKKMLVIEWLQSIKAEKNSIIEKWATCSWKVDNAFDSQSLLQLYNCYCLPKKCLDCAIGLSIFTLRP